MTGIDAQSGRSARVERCPLGGKTDTGCNLISNVQVLRISACSIAFDQRSSTSEARLTWDKPYQSQSRLSMSFVAPRCPRTIFDNRDGAFVMVGVAFAVTVGKSRPDLSQKARPNWLAAKCTLRLRAGCPAIHQDEFHVEPPNESSTPRPMDGMR